MDKENVLINKENLKSKLLNMLDGLCDDVFQNGIERGLLYAIEAIENEPTVDAEPVVHAYWEDRGNDMCSCSRCRFTDLYVNEIDEGSISEYRDENKYCRNCGAKMDKEKEE